MPIGPVEQAESGFCIHHHAVVDHDAVGKWAVKSTGLQALRFYLRPAPFNSNHARSVNNERRLQEFPWISNTPGDCGSRDGGRAAKIQLCVFGAETARAIGDSG